LSYVGSANADDGVRGKLVFRHREVERRGAFADAARDIVVRTVARAEITAEIAFGFAVGRAQTLVYWLHQLIDRGELPRVPVFVDSVRTIFDYDTILHNYNY
jgi:metallo-beta-lactamase family protein